MELMNSDIILLAKKINLIKYPLKTKKSQALNQLNKVSIIIHKSLTKKDLADIFDFLLPNQIKKINILSLPPKKQKVKRRKGIRLSNPKRGYKKAYITLNQSIFSSIFFKSVFLKGEQE